MQEQDHIEPEKFNNERKNDNTETRSGIKGDSNATAKSTKKKDDDKNGLSDSDEEGGGDFERMRQAYLEQISELQNRMATIEKFKEERKQFKSIKRQSKIMEQVVNNEEPKTQYIKQMNVKKVESLSERDDEVNNPNKLPLTKQGIMNLSISDSSPIDHPEKSNLRVDHTKLAVAKAGKNSSNSTNTPDDKHGTDLSGDNRPVMSSHTIKNSILPGLTEGGIVDEMVENISNVTIDASIKALLKERSDRTIINYKGITSLYKPQAVFTWIDGKIPTLFSFQSFHNPMLQSDDERVVERFEFGGALTKQMKESIELVKDGTYAVTLVFDPRNYDIDFTSQDINYYKQVIVTGSQYDSNTTVVELSNRLNRIAKLVNGSFILIRNLTKIKIEETVTNNSIYANLATLIEEDNPHPYFGSRYHKCPWFTKHLESVHTVAPIYIAETNATSDNSHKVSSTYSCITDQFTSKFQRNAFKIIENNLLRTEVWKNRLNANVYKNSEIIDREARDPPMRKFFEPPKHAWDILMYRSLIDREYSNYILQGLIKHVSNTKTFDIAEPVGFIKLLNVTTATGDPSIRKIFTTFPLITPEQFCTLFVCEHYPWKYNVIFETSTDLTIDDTIPELFSMLATKIFFPKLFQRGANSMLYRIMLCLQMLDPTSMRALKENFGYKISLDRNGKLQDVHVEDVISPISHDQSIQGYTYSIATPTESFKFNKKSNLLTTVNKIINMKLSPILLNRKRIANYPYMNKNYMAYASYSNVGSINYNERFLNEYTSVFQDLILAIETAYKNQRKSSGDSVMNFNTRRVFTQYITNLKTVSNTIGPVFWSLGQLSDVLMNSWSYMFEGYEERNPILLQNEFGVTVGEDDAFAGIGRLDLETLRISAHIGGTLYVGLRGGRYRPSIESYLASQAQYRELITAANVIPFDPMSWTKVSYQMATDSYKFGIAMGVFLKFVSIAKGDDVGPEYEFLKRYKKFFQMRTFAELADNVSNIFQVNLRSIYASSFIEGNMRDLRSRKLILTMLDRITDAVIDSPNTRFNEEIIWTDNIVDDTIQTAVQLLLLDESPAHFIGRGLIIQRVKAPNVSPRMEIIEPRLRLDYEVGMFKYTVEGETKGVSMEFIDNDGRKQIVIYPQDPRLDGVRVKFSQIGDLSVYWKDFILESIKEGRMSIEITDIDYKYKIAYWDTNSMDIPDQFEIITRIINSQGGEYVDAIFMDTTYAKRTKVYTIGSHVYTTYLFPLEKMINTGEVITGIYDPVQEPPEFTLDSGDQLGYASTRRGVDFTPISDLPKLYAPRPNMNNILHVYTNAPQFEGDLDMNVKPPADL